MAPSAWLTCEACVMLVSGLFLFFAPQLALTLIMTKATEGVHWHITRCIGGQLIGKAYTWWRLNGANRPEVHTSCFLARLLASILGVIICLHTQSYFAADFQPYVLTSLTILFFMGIVVSLRLLLKTGWILGDRLFKKEMLSNCLLQTDAYAAMIIGCVWMSVPDWLLRRQVAVELGGSHVFLGRMMGSIFFSSHVMSLHGLYWSSADARKHCCFGRAVFCFGILLAQLWSQFAYHQWWTGNHWVGISLFSIWTGLVAWYGVNVKMGKFA